MSGDKVIITKTEYAELLKKAKYYDALTNANMTEYDPVIVECSHPGCAAYAVSNGSRDLETHVPGFRRNFDIFYGADGVFDPDKCMNYCDWGELCRNKETSRWCDEHTFLHKEHKGLIMNVCKDCLVHWA